MIFSFIFADGAVLHAFAEESKKKLDISEYGYESDLDFCEKLAERVGVGAVPGSSFFKEPENRYIRLHFAKKNETLNAALERLADMKAKM